VFLISTFYTQADKQTKWCSVLRKSQVLLLWQLLTKIVNSTLSKFISEVSHGNYKKTQQEVPNVFLLYIYYKYMIHASNK